MLMDEVLNDLYKQHNYDGANVLFQKAKVNNPSITLKFVREWLKKQETHQLTSEKVGKKKYLSIYSEDPYSYQIDLTFFPMYKNQNGGYYVLFTAINVNTRYSFAYCAKNKKMETILDLLKKWKEDSGEIHLITCDQGKEWINREVVKWFDEEAIVPFFVLGDSRKLGIINRFHRTLKEKLLRYFTSTNSYKWVDVLPDIIKNYNNSVNRTIGMTPNQASVGLSEQFIIHLARDHNEQMRDKITLNVGDWVRLKNDRQLFEKMHLKYSPEIYQITKVGKNSVNVVSENKDVVFNRVKLDEVIVVNNIERPIVYDTQAAKQIRQEHQQHNRISRENLDATNILSSRLRSGREN
jgi:hypothetical protein